MKEIPLWIKNNRPAIENRIVHIDLKGPKIPVKSFYRYLKLLSRWGINGVLVEYEHRIPYLPLSQQYPESNRYKEEEIRGLVEYAKNLGIEWIPLIQTFGHVEYLSRVKGTEYLFEYPDYPQQLCPLKKEVKNYIENLIEIICNLHPECRYIHVGQDETRQLGKCQKCKKAIASKGKIEFYLEHCRWVWDIVKKHQRIPLFWADMFFTENRLDLIKDIDRDVIPVVWEYDDIDKITHNVLIGGIKPSIQDVKNLYRVDQQVLPGVRFEKEDRYFEDLPEKIKNDIGIDKKTNYPKSFPQIRIMSKYNRNFWGGCAVYNCSDLFFLPNFIRGVLNPVFMCKVLKSIGGNGIIATNWARAHSYAPISPPWTLSLYNIAHFAAISYTGRTQPSDIKEISKLVAKEIGMPFNFDRFSLDDILNVISSTAPGPGVASRIKNLENVLSTIHSQETEGIFGKGLKISVEAELLWTKLLFLQEEARWWTSTRKEIPQMIKKEMVERFRVIKKEIERLKSKAFHYYTEYVGDKKTFTIWWKGLFELDTFLSEKAIRFLTH